MGRCMAQNVFIACTQAIWYDKQFSDYLAPKIRAGEGTTNIFADALANEPRNRLGVVVGTYINVHNQCDSKQCVHRQTRV